MYLNVQNFDKARASIANLAGEQQGCDSRSVTGIYNKALSRLRRHVAQRKKYLAQANCEEILTGNALAFEMIRYFPVLENDYWSTASSKTLANSLSDSRNRMIFLATKQSLSRCEVFTNGRLCHLHAVTVQKQDEPMDYEVIRMAIPIGKMSNGKTPFASMMRALDPTMCGPGAIYFYLDHRFLVTSEDDYLNFSANENWFAIKLLADRNTNHTNNKFKEKAEVMAVALLLCLANDLKPRAE